MVVADTAKYKYRFSLSFDGADEIAKQASSEVGSTIIDLKMEVQKRPSIEEFHTFAIQRKNNSWMTPILSFLRDGQLLANVKEVRKVRKRATRFTILNNALYKRGFSMPYLKCVQESEAKYILEEIHEGVCRDHTGLRSLVSKIVKIGYFWYTMQRDAKEFIERCDKCQMFVNVQHNPGEKLTPIASPWPFAQWGIDIMGPLPQVKRQVKFLPVAINYFTKWVKAKVLPTIMEAKIQNFVWKNIVCRFGIPQTIISDNGRQFDSQDFRNFCSGLGIKNQFSFPGHP